MVTSADPVFELQVRLADLERRMIMLERLHREIPDFPFPDRVQAGAEFDADELGIDPEEDM